MNRRAFLGTIAGGLLHAPLAVEAQQAGKVRKIGYLAGGISAGEYTGTKSFFQKTFLQGLHDLGYVEGRHFIMEYRFADGHYDRLPELAADLVRGQVDVIVTVGTPATSAAKQATQTIPIVFPILGRAVEKGIVASLARPGGNMTGLTTQLETLKVYQLLKEAAPTVVRVVYLYDPQNTLPGWGEQLHSQAQAVNVEWQSVAMRDPNDIAQAFTEFGRGTNGLVLDFAARLQLKADQICRLALQRRLPAVALTRTFADAGCLMSYAEDAKDMFRRAAGLVDRIFKGAKPADLPVEHPTKFELVINLKTAKALGLTIPPSLLSRADELIQ